MKLAPACRGPCLSRRRCCRTRRWWWPGTQSKDWIFFPFCPGGDSNTGSQD